MDFEIKTDSSKVVRFFNRAYSLFSRHSYIKKRICFRASKKNSADKNISEINTKIYNALLENYNEKCIFLHASSASFHSNNILFMGGSRSGKSSLAAMLRDKGARLYADDLTLIEYKTNRLVRVPFFPNIRKGEFSKLQKQYVGLFEPYLKKFNTIRRDFLSSMPETTYRMYYAFSKELYAFSGSVSQRGKKFIGIFLKRDKKRTTASLKRIDFPTSFNMFMNSMHLPESFFKKNLKNIVKLYRDIDFYSLRSHSIKESARLIESNFKF